MLENEKGEPLQLTGKESYEETLDAARQLVQDDPKRVSQMIKQWVAES
jgi:flagellar M-ring protein FliF